MHLVCTLLIYFARCYDFVRLFLETFRKSLGDKIRKSHAGVLFVPSRAKNRFNFLFSKGFKGALACVVFCCILTEGHSRAQAGASASCQPLTIPPKKGNRPNHPQEQTLRDCLDSVLHALKLSLRLL